MPLDRRNYCAQLRSRRYWRPRAHVLACQTANTLSPQDARVLPVQLSRADNKDACRAGQASQLSCSDLVSTATPVSSVSDIEVDREDAESTANSSVDAASCSTPCTLVRDSARPGIHVFDEEWADALEWKTALHTLYVAFESWAQLLYHEESRSAAGSSSPRSVQIDQVLSDERQRHAAQQQKLEEANKLLQQPCFLERQIVCELSACTTVQQRLISALQTVRTSLDQSMVHSTDVMLYGSLCLGRAGCARLRDNQTKDEDAPYITNVSDVDYAILVEDPVSVAKVSSDIVRSVSSFGWRQLRSTSVPRFAVSQWTLVNEMGVHLDLTCIHDADHFHRFAMRQFSFRELFWQLRGEFATFLPEGACIFDAYIYLVKAFAAFASRHIFTSFQAVCLSLHVVQIFLKESPRRPCLIGPSALGLFREFLEFCARFFGDHVVSYKQYAIDLTEGGQLTERVSTQHLAELFFVSVERRIQPSSCDWLNVLHNLDPPALSSRASWALQSWFDSPCPLHTWSKIRSDVAPSMLPNRLHNERDYSMHR